MKIGSAINKSAKVMLAILALNSLSLSCGSGNENAQDSKDGFSLANPNIIAEPSTLAASAPVNTFTKKSQFLKQRDQVLSLIKELPSIFSITHYKESHQQFSIDDVGDNCNREIESFKRKLEDLGPWKTYDTDLGNTKPSTLADLLFSLAEDLSPRPPERKQSEEKYKIEDIELGKQYAVAKRIFRESTNGDKYTYEIGFGATDNTLLTTFIEVYELKKPHVLRGQNGKRIHHHFVNLKTKTIQIDEYSSQQEETYSFQLRDILTVKALDEISMDSKWSTLSTDTSEGDQYIDTKWNYLFTKKDNNTFTLQEEHHWQDDYNDSTRDSKNIFTLSLDKDKNCKVTDLKAL